MLYEQIMNEFRPKLLLLVQKNHKRVIFYSLETASLTNPCINIEHIQAALLQDPALSTFYQQLSITERLRFDTGLPIVIKIEIINCYLQRVTEAELKTQKRNYGLLMQPLRTETPKTPETETSLAALNTEVQVIYQMIDLRTQYCEQLPELQQSLTMLVLVPTPFFAHPPLQPTASDTATPATSPVLRGV